MKNQKGFVNIIVGIVIALLVVGGGYYVWQKKTAVKNFETKLSACNSLPNNSVKSIRETSRLFIDLPRDLYEKDLSDNSSNFTTVEGNATAGYVSNGGPYGNSMQSTSDCWSTYFEFSGIGEVDLRVKGTSVGTPDYFVRFIVSSTDQDSSNTSTGPAGVALPSYCKVIRTDYSTNPTTGDVVQRMWDIDCGSDKNTDARGTMESILEEQGWKSCGFGLGSAFYWKSGITTTVGEGADATHFRVAQELNREDCSDQR